MPKRTRDEAHSDSMSGWWDRFVTFFFRLDKKARSEDVTHAVDEQREKSESEPFEGDVNVKDSGPMCDSHTGETHAHNDLDEDIAKERTEGHAEDDNRNEVDGHSEVDNRNEDENQSEDDDQSEVECQSEDDDQSENNSQGEDDKDSGDSASDSSDSSIVMVDTPSPPTPAQPAPRMPSSPQPPVTTSSLSRFLASRPQSIPNPRPSPFRPQYAPTKTLFKSKRSDTPRQHRRRTVSSMNQRRKGPLAMDEFKAGMRAKQQARIASMIHESYRGMRRGSMRYEDFHALVRKRTHVQLLMDLETLRMQPLTPPVLDEQAYTQRTLEALSRREAHAKAQLPPPIVPAEAKLSAARDARRKRLDTHGVLGRGPLPKALPPDADAVVSDIWDRRSGVVASMTGAQVEAHDMAKLRPGKWLNDEVINFYGQLLMQRSSQAEASDCWRIHVFSSFFWQNLTTRGYAGVRRWSRRVDIFTKDLILLPINVGQAHWVCAAINLRLRRFEYYDSMGIPSPGVFATLRAYISDEMRDKKQLEIDLSDWTDYFAGETSPQQQNGYDCGVFAVQTLEQLSRRDPAVPYPPRALEARLFTAPADPTELALLREEHACEYAWNFDQRDMPYLRRRMTYEIYTKQLLP